MPIAHLTDLDLARLSKIELEGKFTRAFEVLEPFTFADGSRRLAYFNYVIVGGEARCVGVWEVQS